MAKQNESIPSSEEHTVNEIYTKHGNLAVRYGSHTYESEDNGRDIITRVFEHLESPQGTIMGPQDAMGQRAGGTGLATCDKCDEELHSVFSHSEFYTTLCPATTMRRCHRCRANLCERHYFISLVDNMPRCRWHDLLHWAYHKILRLILFHQA